MAESTETNPVALHYGQNNISAKIIASLRAAGKDLNSLTVDDLSTVDQFHIRGKAATTELLGMAQISPGSNVLDVGGGLGGPARLIASQLGCHVTVLDLTESYCRAGEMITALVGLSDCVEFRMGNALNMPFGDGQFDTVWTQHSSMNIEDKERLYSEVFRVLKPGGQLAINDIIAGDVQPIHFPVPWARTADISFLRPAAETRQLLSHAGFKELAWKDASEESIAFIRQRPLFQSPAGAPQLGMQDLIGPVAIEMSRNFIRNVEEKRLAVIFGVYERAG